MTSGPPQPSASLDIQVAAHESNVDYLRACSVAIGVVNRQQTEHVVLEDVSLSFQTDYPIPNEVVTIKATCNGCQLAPDAREYFPVTVKPSLLYRPYTNYFGVSVSYRSRSQGTLSAFADLTVSNASYLVIKNAPTFAPARVFVSFKDPEDAELAMLAATFLQRAGMEPYLARQDPRPGTVDYWATKIEPAIRSSVALLVIWTTKTAGQDESVVREVEIARRAGVPDVLLLQRDTAPPKEYPAARIEHAKFTREAPWMPFAEAIEVVATRIRAGKGV